MKEFHQIREGFHQMREEFHPHKTHVARLSSLYSLSNCAMKLCIETGLMVPSTHRFPPRKSLTTRQMSIPALVNQSSPPHSFLLHLYHTPPFIPSLMPRATPLHTPRILSCLAALSPTASFRSCSSYRPRTQR